MEERQLSIQLTNTKQEEKDFSEKLFEAILHDHHLKPAVMRIFNIIGLVFFTLADIFTVGGGILLSYWTFSTFCWVLFFTYGIVQFSTIDKWSYYDRCKIRGLITLKNILVHEKTAFDPATMCFYENYVILPEGCRVHYSGFEYTEKDNLFVLCFHYGIIKKLYYFIKIEDVPKNKLKPFRAFLEEKQNGGFDERTRL